MKNLDLTQLTNEELQLEAKKQKSAFNAFKFIIGLLVGVSIYLTIKSGFGVFTILPVAFAPLLFAMKARLNEIKKEMESRKL